LADELREGSRLREEKGIHGEEGIGFDEGPVFQESWEYLAERGIEIRRNVCREQARAVLDQYTAGGAPIYNG
jgi:hypothetical protein